jgi:hypothetical protein
MGLDVAFYRKQAISEGMKSKVERNGTDEDIDRFIRVPGMNHWVEDVGVDQVIVRANKWGHTYEPLTNWLKVNNIGWSEF